MAILIDSGQRAHPLDEGTTVQDLLEDDWPSVDPGSIGQGDIFGTGVARP